MKKQHAFIAYILIGVGTYFLIRQLDLALFANFYGWPTFLLIIGAAYLIDSYARKDYYHIFTGVLLLGLGIHFHLLENYAFWTFDHWSVYAFIVGLAFLIRWMKTKQGFIIGVVLITIAILMFFSISLPSWFAWLYWLIDFLETFWPVALIGLGIYLLKFKK
ncbi:MAG TPA: DUF5668 domain-containing protein [Pseudogracilibacillus sp.]|nr:DUF5668 domain-containing protein [Pseudogracilibacillus sp.]